METGKCQYCGVKLQKRATVCSNCCSKRKVVRQLKKILAEIEKAERKDENA